MSTVGAEFPIGISVATDAADAVTPLEDTAGAIDAIGAAAEKATGQVDALSGAMDTLTGSNGALTGSLGTTSGAIGVRNGALSDSAIVTDAAVIGAQNHTGAVTDHTGAVTENTGAVTDNTTAAIDHGAQVTNGTGLLTEQIVTTNTLTTAVERHTAALTKQSKFINKVGKWTILGGAIVGALSVHLAGNFAQDMLQVVTGAAEPYKNLRRDSAALLAMAPQVGVSPTALAADFYQVSSAGFHGAQALAIVRAAAEGAQVGQADPIATAQAVTSILASYNMKGTQADSVVNELIAAVSRGKMHLQELNPVLSYVVPQAALLGVKLPGLLSAISSMTRLGTTPSEASQNIANFLRSVANPTATTVKEWGQLGLNQESIVLSLRKNGIQGTIAIIDNAVKAHTNKAGDVVYNAIMQSSLLKSQLQTEYNATAATSPFAAQLEKEYSAGLMTYPMFRKFIPTGPGRPELLAWLKTYETLHGFNALLSSGKPNVQSVYGALSSALGTSSAAAVALQTGGTHSATTEATTRAIATAAANNKTVENWNRVAALFNTKLHMVEYGAESGLINFGNYIIPGVESAAHHLDNLYKAIEKNRAMADTFKDALIVLGGIIGATFVVNKVSAFAKAMGGAIGNVGTVAKGLWGVLKGINSFVFHPIKGIGAFLTGMKNVVTTGHWKGAGAGPTKTTTTESQSTTTTTSGEGAAGNNQGGATLQEAGDNLTAAARLLQTAGEALQTAAGTLRSAGVANESSNYRPSNYRPYVSSTEPTYTDPVSGDQQYVQNRNLMTEEERAAQQNVQASTNMENASNNMESASAKMEGAGSNMEGASAKMDAAGNKQDLAGNKESAAASKMDLAGDKQDTAGNREIVASDREMTGGAGFMGGAGKLSVAVPLLITAFAAFEAGKWLGNKFFGSYDHNRQVAAQNAVNKIGDTAFFKYMRQEHLTREGVGKTDWYAIRKLFREANGGLPKGFSIGFGAAPGHGTLHTKQLGDALKIAFTNQRAYNAAMPNTGQLTATQRAAIARQDTVRQDAQISSMLMPLYRAEHVSTAKAMQFIVNIEHSTDPMATAEAARAHIQKVLEGINAGQTGYGNRSSVIRPK